MKFAKMQANCEFVFHSFNSMDIVLVLQQRVLTFLLASLTVR